MELKFPKKITILSEEYTMVYDKRESGGWFENTDYRIGIGTRDLKVNPNYVFMIICHEVMEAITCITSTRFTDNGAYGDYKFFMDHKQFEVNMQIFASVIKNFIK